MLRVGRCVYDKGKRIDPSCPRYKKILIMMKSHSKWWPLSPYYLYDEEGQIFENIWQASKVYKTVPKTTQRYSRYNNKIIWQHPEETHVRGGKITRAYKRWRDKLMRCPYAVRYPVGYKHRHKCLYALANKPDGSINTENKLDYIQARKKIYVKEYCRLVRQQPFFMELKKRLKKGEKLLIVEVDGPHQESLDYYMKKYKVNKNFLKGGTMLVTKENLDIMLNDRKHPFGHCYCIAVALLDLEDELI